MHFSSAKTEPATSVLDCINLERVYLSMENDPARANNMKLRQMKQKVRWQGSVFIILFIICFFGLRPEYFRNL